MRPLALALLAFIWTGTALAEVERMSAPWTVAADFGKGAKARNSISGAACAPNGTQCLGVNDEKKYAQFFTISDRTIVPGSIIRLLADKVDGAKMKEIDAEGAVFVPAAKDGEEAAFYVTGSHGRARSGDLRPSQFFLFRIPVNSETGLPDFPFNDDVPAGKIQATSLLRDTIKSLEILKPFAEKKLDRNGVTIEGLSATERDLVFGLRSPCLDEHAFVFRVAIDELFQKSAPTAAITALRLGDNTGIRDLARVGDGFLILSGRSDDRRGDQARTCGEKRVPADVKPALWLWSGSADDTTPVFLGTFPGLTEKDSAETLLLLEETDTFYRVLVLLDGVENGAPAEFRIPK